MSKGLVLSLVILGVLAVSLFFILQTEDGAKEISRLLDRVGIAIPLPQVTKKSVPPSFVSGNSRFSNGSCTEDTDCLVTGCSGEVCGNESVITTCEYREDFPNKRTHTCGCVQKKCGWRSK